MRQNCQKLPGLLNRLSVVALLFILWICMPATRASAETCPWLNAATAAGTLDGPVTFSITHSSRNKEDSTCEYTRQEGSTVTRLRIEVETMTDPSRDFASYTAECGPAATPLRAIGNEALTCDLRKKNQISEQIVSRVRERAFIVAVSSNAHSRDQDALRVKVEKIAEQVAGFLF